MAGRHRSQLLFEVKPLFQGRHKPLTDEKDLLSAQLRLFRKPSNALQRQYQRSKSDPVSLIVTVVHHRHELASSEPLRFKLQDGVLQVDITDFLQKVNISQMQPRFLRLKITTRRLASGEGINPVDIFDLHSETTTTKPLLVVFTKENKNIVEEFLESLSLAVKTARKKRETGAEGQGMWQRLIKDESCSKHDLFVRFAEINWHHIMAPLFYNAFDCRGKCSAPFRGTSNHAIVRTWVWLQQRPEERPELNICCSPKEFEPLSLVMEVAEDSNYLIQSYANMAALSCSCK